MIGGNINKYLRNEYMYQQNATVAAAVATGLPATLTTLANCSDALKMILDIMQGQTIGAVTRFVNSRVCKSHFALRPIAGYADPTAETVAAMYVLTNNLVECFRKYQRNCAAVKRLTSTIVFSATGLSLAGTYPLTTSSSTADLIKVVDALADFMVALSIATRS